MRRCIRQAEYVLPPVSDRTLLTPSKGIEPDQPRKLSRLSTGSVLSAFGPDRAVEPREKVKELLVVVAEEYKAKARNAYDQEKQAAIEKITRLESQLSAYKKEAQEWRAEAEKWKAEADEWMAMGLSIMAKQRIGCTQLAHLSGTSCM